MSNSMQLFNCALGFLKFQDSEEITNHELADAFEQMWEKQR